MTRDAFFTDKDLVKKSDLIIKGKVISQNESFTKTIDVVNDDGTKGSFEFPYKTYTVEIIDDIKGNVKDQKEIELLTVDDSIEGTFNGFESGKEYVLYLYNCNDNNFPSNTYAVVSYYNGVFVNDTDNKFKNVLDKSIVNYDNIKQKVKDNLR